MSGALTPQNADTGAITIPENHVPAVVAASGEDAFRRYLEFFAAHIRNPNTRNAYLHAVRDFFGWCDTHGIGHLAAITRLHVAAYIEDRMRHLAAPTVKLRLAAVKMLFEHLRLSGGNPAECVRGPKHVVRVGRTPVLTGEQTRRLIESIPTGTLSGLRDRALIAVMVYTFGRVSAVVGMTVGDYHLNGNRRWVRLREKGGKEHALPLHHKAEEHVDAYLAAINQAASEDEIASHLSGLPTPHTTAHLGRADKHTPLFRTVNKHGRVTDQGVSRMTAWEMVKRRARTAGLPDTITNHSFRATGITVYLQNGGTIENARNIAAHASIRTTQVYDRRGDAVTLEEINRIHL